SLQFEIMLNQLISVGEGLAKAIVCLEATSSNPANVYLYWLAVLAHMKESLTKSGLPNDVCNEICRIINH
ncbi:hypothetical protein L208DRAFT_1246588, partial [Tricholoma matsutake]